MKSNQKPSAAWTGAERRSGKDRRVQDVGPKGDRERRRSLEARKPEVVEIQMTDDEWGRLYQTGVPAPRAASPGAPVALAAKPDDAGLNPRRPAA